MLTADSDISSQVDWILSFYPSPNIQGEISLLSSCIQEDFHTRSMALEFETRKEAPDLDLLREFHCSGVSCTRFGRSLTMNLFNQLFCEENPLYPPTMLDEKQSMFQMYNSLSKERQLELLRQWMGLLGLHEDAAELDWKTWLVRLNLLQISQQQAVWRAATYGGSVVGDIGNGNWQGGVVPLNRHAQRVAYQHDVKSFISK